MFKKFLHGLVFGAGFGISLVAIWSIAIYFVIPRLMERHLGPGAMTGGGKKTTVVPSIEEPKRFLGSTGTYSSDFRDSNEVLAAGPGKIVGEASVNGEPLEGLKLRLALNGAVMSQWALSDAQGRYAVRVPYGTYAIDGIELDHQIANEVLPNKINHPENPHATAPFVVSAQNDGQGLNLRFVDPVVKAMAKSRFSPSEPVLLEWQPYPQAAEYLVQVYEKTEPYGWSEETLFEWSDRPRVSVPRLDLQASGMPLKPGHYYSFEVSARDRQGRILAETGRTYSGYDFQVTKE